ncbi:MAG: sigma-54-dependent transcriptional regulator [Bacteroidales bacterium]
MNKGPSILIVDDNKTILQTLELLLKGFFDRIETLSNPNGIDSALLKSTFDVILLDMNFRNGVNNGNEGLFWLSRIKDKRAGQPVVLFTAYADIDLAVEGMKNGATDFITKPWDNERLIATLLKAAASQKSSVKSNSKGTSKEKRMFWGKSARMLQLKDLVERIATTDANVLITGENGTGKEMLAREIHALSARKSNAFVTVDMGAIPDTLFESELFGYIKGAFTDAKTDKKGKFEMADKGTLFMDEIANMPLMQQVKLLSSMQTREVIPVGGSKPVPVNIRLISATNANLPYLVRENAFREDLFYRINTIHIQIPSLRDRIEDLESFAGIFIEKYAARYGFETPKISKEALHKLSLYSWPGNIRELEHAIEKAVIMCSGGMIREDLFSFRSDSVTTSEASSSVQTLEEMERIMIEQSIQECEGNLSAVAQRLGISRQTLYNKMKKFNL